jgi:hypothetical protein
MVHDIQREKLQMTIFPNKKYDTYQSKNLQRQTRNDSDTVGGIESCQTISAKGNDRKDSKGCNNLDGK